jgi:hypothetical protein
LKADPQSERSPLAASFADCMSYPHTHARERFGRSKKGVLARTVCSSNKEATMSETTPTDRPGDPRDELDEAGDDVARAGERTKDDVAAGADRVKDGAEDVAHKVSNAVEDVIPGDSDRDGH